MSLPAYAVRAAELWAAGLSQDSVLDRLAEEGFPAIGMNSFSSLRSNHPDLFPRRSKADHARHIAAGLTGNRYPNRKRP